MDGVSAATTARGTEQVAQAMQVFALKQSMQSEAATVAALLQSLPRPGPVVQGVGQNVDLTA